ncbi:hypothetical protein RGH81_001016 [Acinetobacter nosocomialis]|nr:hypothetical protein [Acinetobacter nosocomialis]
MLRFLITLLILAISHSTLANNNFDADGGLIKLGIIGQDFKYIDLDQAIEFFKIGNEGAKSTFPYKANRPLAKVVIASSSDLPVQRLS